MLADVALAQKLGWRVPMPLLGTAMLHASLKTGPERWRLRPGDPGWAAACHAARDARGAGRADCRLDELIADIQDELRGRPYELVLVAGGWQHRTGAGFADAIRSARGDLEADTALNATENLVVTAIAHLRPVTRAELSQLLGKEVSRDTIARLKRLDLVAAGPRMPALGAPLTYVTTSGFLSFFGLSSLRDMPDIESLEEAGILQRRAPFEAQPDDLDDVLGLMLDYKTDPSSRTKGRSRTEHHRWREWPAWTKEPDRFRIVSAMLIRLRHF